VDVSPRNSTSSLVNQTVHLVEKVRKAEVLSHLVRTNDWHQVLVFTRTKHGANRLAERLERDGIVAAAIHGNKSQSARTKALSGFKTGEVRVLVATDIAARGLDIEQLPQVVNYELPNVPEDYVHRIGRTGRAGSPGAAVSLVDGEEMAFLRDIERLLRRAIDRAPVEGWTPSAAPQPENLDRPPMPPRRGRGGPPAPRTGPAAGHAGRAPASSGRGGPPRGPSSAPSVARDAGGNRGTSTTRSTSPSSPPLGVIRREPSGDDNGRGGRGGMGGGSWGRGGGWGGR
jgi:ATP-dependent RNA helicase RhlE